MARYNVKVVTPKYLNLTAKNNYFIGRRGKHFESYKEAFKEFQRIYKIIKNLLAKDTENKYSNLFVVMCVSQTLTPDKSCQIPEPQRVKLTTKGRPRWEVLGTKEEKGQAHIHIRYIW